MDDIVFIGAPHETPLFEDAGFRCFEPAPGYLTERVLAERKRCRLMALTRETFVALPHWLAYDLLEWTPEQIFIVPEVPRTSADKRLVLGEILRRAARTQSSVA